MVEFRSENQCEWFGTILWIWLVFGVEIWLGICGFILGTLSMLDCNIFPGLGQDYLSTEVNMFLLPMQENDGDDNLTKAGYTEFIVTQGKTQLSSCISCKMGINLYCVKAQEHTRSSPCSRDTEGILPSPPWFQNSAAKYWPCPTVSCRTPSSPRRTGKHHIFFCSLSAYNNMNFICVPLIGARGQRQHKSTTHNNRNVSTVRGLFALGMWGHFRFIFWALLPLLDSRQHREKQETWCKMKRGVMCSKCCEMLWFVA